MSVPPRRGLPERPSLEQLRKQAKDHLHTLCVADGGNPGDWLSTLDDFRNWLIREAA